MHGLTSTFNKAFLLSADVLKHATPAVHMKIRFGIMKIAEKSGLVQLIAKAIKPITKKLFNELPEDSPAIGDIAMNFTANAFGLANAATPFGIRAMENMQEVNIQEHPADGICRLYW